MNKLPEIPVYVAHAGTVLISGSTESKRAATCALHHLSQGVSPVDFFYIGANAGQQAMKAMGILRYVFERNTDGKSTILFQPNRVRTKTRNPGYQPNDLMDAVYWRVYPIRTDDIPKLDKQNDTNPDTATAGSS